jgi:nicotinate-nucleotide pyrophosphorylase (carboxylating)
MRPSTVDALVAGGLDPTDVARVIRAALDEDLGPDWLDVTSRATIPGDQTGIADLVARADGVLAGIAVVAATFELVDGRTVVTPVATDGARVSLGAVLATVSGPTRGLLTAERTALNLLCRLSGVATHTRGWVEAVAGTKARILDTRKTTPGLRALEKYAVRIGGGANKRMGLYDVAMVKDNHVRAAGGVGPAFARVRSTYPDLPVQVEVRDLAEAVAAVEAGARFLLCDNMPPAELRRVVAAVGDRAELEATGGLTLAKAREYAETGVDYLSVGALTHSSPILDIAMDLRGADAALHRYR